MGNTLEKDIETLQNDLSKFRDHLSSTLSDVGHLSQEELSKTRDRLKAAMEHFGSTAQDRIAHLNETVHKGYGIALKASREAATKRPFTVIAVSFGIGALTAALLRRRNHG